MPISLKKLAQECLHEGMSIHVSGHNYERDMKDLNDLSWWIQKKVLSPLLQKMPADAKSNIKHDMVLPDGTSMSDKTGILNIYIEIFPEEWRPKVLGGISYFLQKKGIETGKWIVDTSKMFGGTVIRIPITYLPTAPDPAKSLDVGMGTINAVRTLLGLGLDYGPSDTFSIDPKELYDKIEEYDGLVSKSLIAKPSPHYAAVIHTLKEMAQWALAHGYSKIVGG